MSDIYYSKATDGFSGSYKKFLKELFTLKEIDGILLPVRLPINNQIMTVLVTDPAMIDNAVPLPLISPVNSGKILAKLTVKPSGSKICAVLRPCEIRAFIELVKFRQGKTDDVIIITTDCRGVLSNSDYYKLAEEESSDDLNLLHNTFLSSGNLKKEIKLSSACTSCEEPVSQNGDINISLFGVDTTKDFFISANSPAGKNILEKTDFSISETPPGRKDEVKKVIANNIEIRDKMFEKTRDSVNTIEKLSNYFAKCINCYNCRVACPICYCRECVFSTEVFDHDPFQYMDWANKKGALKMPSDTVFFHITRIAHISTSCVGCGQCSNACPNDIPVAELFKTISYDTQNSFEYKPGRNLEEKPPLTVFKENEYDDVIGIK